MLSNCVMKPLTKLDVRNPQHVDMVWITMYEMLVDMEHRNRLMMTSSVMLKIMDKCFESVNPSDVIAGIRNTVLNLIMSSYIKMKPKQRKKMISMYRELLDEIEILCVAYASAKTGQEDETC